MAAPKGRILCTEDDPDTRELLTVVLQDQGYEVTCTSNAEEAISLAKTETFDLYVMDNWLPQVAGPTLTSQIREFDTETPVLFYSAAALEADKEEALAAGAQSYLVKPIAHQELIREVARLIAGTKTATTWNSMLERQLKLEAQEALDELWQERRLPYKLTAHQVSRIEDVEEYYEIRFFDSRKQSIAVRWQPEREDFKSAVRSAIEVDFAKS